MLTRFWKNCWRPRFRLRSLLWLILAVAVICTGLRWRHARIRELDEAVSRLVALGVRVSFRDLQEEPPVWRRIFSYIWGESRLPPVRGLDFKGGTFPCEAIHACLPRLRQVTERSRRNFRALVSHDR